MDAEQARRGPALSAAVAIVLCMVVARLGVLLLPQYRSILVIIGLFSCLVDRRNGRDKLLVFVLAYLGFAPLLSWVHGAAAFVDPLVLCAGAAIGHVMYDVRRRPTFDLRSLLALPATIFAFWWWRPLYSGPMTLVLRRMENGWDHFGHFDLYASAREGGVFRAVSAGLANAHGWFNTEYPAGIHSALAFVWKPTSGTRVTRWMLLTDYRHAVMINFCLVILILGLALLRVARSRTMTVSAFIITSPLTIGLATIGYLSISFWGGFPNYGMAIAASVAVASMAARPVDRSLLHFLGLAGGILIVAYNWYPLSLVLVGVVIRDVWRQFRSAGSGGRSMLATGYSVVAVAAATPVVLTFGLGTKQLVVDGGIPTPSSSAMVGAFGLLFLGWYVLHRRNTAFRPLLLLAETPVAAVVVVAGITVAIRVTSGDYPYYQQKIALGILTIVIFDVARLFIEYVEESASLVSIRRRVQNLVVAVLAVASFVQMFGYIGPDWSTFAGSDASLGLTHRQAILSVPTNQAYLGRVLFHIEQAMKDRPEEQRECVVLADFYNQFYDPILTNYWVGSMLRTVTERHIARAQDLGVWRSNTLDMRDNARTIDRTLDIRHDCPLVNRKARKALIGIDNRWSVRTLILELDGSLTVPEEFNP